MVVLVLNCGSSSVKFQVIALETDPPGAAEPRRLARGTLERVEHVDGQRRIASSVLSLPRAELLTPAEFAALDHEASPEGVIV